PYASPSSHPCFAPLVHHPLHSQVSPGLHQIVLGVLPSLNPEVVLEPQTTGAARALRHGLVPAVPVNLQQQVVILLYTLCNEILAVHQSLKGLAVLVDGELVLRHQPCPPRVRHHTPGTSTR